MKGMIGNFLVRRLQEARIPRLLGVPCDFNLGLMQQRGDRGEPGVDRKLQLAQRQATSLDFRVARHPSSIRAHSYGKLLTATIRLVARDTFDIRSGIYEEDGRQL